MTNETSLSNIDKLDRLFSGEIKFVFGSNTPSDFPKGEMPEFAFIGKSNVGKSSLINALTNRKALARTSHTPGRTKQLNFFDVRGLFYIVDVPGYGYAKVSKQEQKTWGKLVYSYLAKRKNLACVFLLIDSRHGIKENDLQVFNLLDDLGVYYYIIYTKTDKISQNEEAKLIEDAKKASLLKSPIILLTNSKKPKGVDELKLSFYDMLRDITVLA
ncbi:MAG: ribosome biogenesis GTP-binding protein YihA/YsxC [Rickettsiaceae bacterium]|nr:ribosome biogenesis GTP-binding protein YihA/YsxC [Rickettsiaceae bacterium]